MAIASLLEAAPATQPALPTGASPASAVGDKPVPVEFKSLTTFRYRQSIDGWLITSDTTKPATQAATTKPLDEIPARVRAFSGRRIVLTGFMIPVQSEEGRTREFLLAPSMQHCMYCAVPLLNKMVVVNMKDKKGVAYRAASPIVVTGRIEVGEKYEDGIVTSLYRMEGERVADAATDPIADEP